jgi:tetratricopeptide (TPR) repeat protein
MSTGLIVLAMLLWAGPAGAQDEVGLQPDPDGQETLVAPPVASAAELVELARDRLEGHDYHGARIALDQALDRPGVDVDLVAYLRGVSWELEGDPAQAIRLYDEGMAQWPVSPLNRDRAFRKAEALGTLGVPKEGLDWLQRIDARDLEPLDRQKYELVEGILTVQAGRTRRGLRILRDVLQDLSEEELTFYQAKARATIARVLADQAAQLAFDKGEKKLVKRVQERAALIDGIEKQVTEAAELDEPEWVLEGLLALGGAYQAFGDDLLVHKRPRKLTPEQLEVYEEGVLGKVEAMWVKAMRSYDLGLEMATRIGWKSRRVEELEAAREMAVARIEGL